MFVFILPVLTVWLLLEYYSRNRIGNNVLAKLKLIEDYSPSINTLIIGNSHARNGLISKEFPGNTINAAIGGSTVFYNKVVLEQAMEQSTEGNLQNLIIAVSYQTLFKDFYREETLPRRFEFYHYLGADYHLPDHFDMRKHSVLFTTSFSAMMENFWKDRKGQADKVYQDLGYTPTSRVLGEEKADALSQKRIGIHHDMMTEDPAIFQENIAYLESMLAMASKQGIQTFVITTPVTPQYYALERPPYKHFTDSLVTLVKKYQATYWNDAQMASLSDLRYFKDSDHLNQFGAAIYTDTLINRLQK